jgi:flagellar assembly protein FliH
MIKSENDGNRSANTEQSWDALSDAESLLKKSIGDSQFIEARAKSEAQFTVSEAKEQGISKGYENGLALGVEEAIRAEEEKKRAFFNAFLELEANIANCYQKHLSDSEFLEVAFELAQKIINIEIEKNDDSYFCLYRKAAVHISNAEKVTLKAGPRGYQVAQSMREEFEDAIDGLERIDIVLSGNDNGLCVLETPLGNVDSSVEAQLQRAKKIITPQG